jgi:drug/metabolite transporter (DMT)-like permease
MALLMTRSRLGAGAARQVLFLGKSIPYLGRWGKMAEADFWHGWMILVHLLAPAALLPLCSRRFAQLRPLRYNLHTANQRRTMSKDLSPRYRAVLQALLVTFLWSTSWVLIKFGLQEIPALTFAGLRYTLAFVCLLPFALRSGQLASLRTLSTKSWVRLMVLGLLFYSVTQGAQFLSLFYLPAMTTTVLLSFTPILVALLGISLLGERPTRQQWAGTAMYLVGVLVYFQPLSLPSREVVGLLVAGTCVLANALSSILGRHVNRSGELEPTAVTVVSMGSGAIVLLVAGIAVQGLPGLAPAHWAIIIWLAVVNSALAYTLWNRTLRTLSAMESSIINNTMLIQIAVLAWLFLGESLTWLKVTGMALVALGTLIVQKRRFHLGSSPR